MMMMMMFVAYLLVDANDGWTKDNTYLFTLSSCLLRNTTQLHYYCADSEQDATVPIAVNNLNTVEIIEHLCGSYRDHQGMYG